MINYFMKKKEDQENGFYHYIRYNRQAANRIGKIHSQDRIGKFALYQETGERKKGLATGDRKFRIRPAVSDSIERRSNSTKFKSLNEYFNQKVKTEVEEE